MSDIEMIRPLTTLGAVVLGFVLGQASDFIKVRRQAKRRRLGVRQLIALEAGHNIVLVRDFWQSILSNEETWETEDGEFPYVRLALHASQTLYPQINTGAWSANLGEVVSSYGKDELEKIWRFQVDLEKLCSLHDFFCRANDERRDTTQFSHAAYGNPMMGNLTGSIQFSGAVNEPAREFKKLITQIIDLEHAACITNSSTGRY
ncbi:hypothetical protein [Marinobacter sp.]|uniref:hypothetical protein n=1 Tax=Marinobacter sp. TaxID=50741 RepID=UPI003BAC8961